MSGKKPKSQASSVLYPTVAISDVAMVLSHAYAAYLVYDTNSMAAVGLLYVAFAAAAGVLRFGVNCDMFRPVHGEWGKMAGCIGLPMVGHYASKPFLLSLVSFNPRLHRAATVLTEPAACVSGLALFYSLIRAYKGGSEKVMGLFRTIFVALFFVLPVFFDGYVRGDGLLMGSVALVLFGGLSFGSPGHVLGIRTENWFHYVIATAAYGIGLALSRR